MEGTGNSLALGMEAIENGNCLCGRHTDQFDTPVNLPVSKTE